MLEAKNMMHDASFHDAIGLWPTVHAESLAAFFATLERHPRRFMANGNHHLLAMATLFRFVGHSVVHLGSGKPECENSSRR
jgi:hypothetical protein